MEVRSTPAGLPVFFVLTETTRAAAMCSKLNPAKRRFWVLHTFCILDHAVRAQVVRLILGSGIMIRGLTAGKRVVLTGRWQENAVISSSTLITGAKMLLTGLWVENSRALPGP